MQVNNILANYVPTSTTNNNEQAQSTSNNPLVDIKKVVRVCNLRNQIKRLKTNVTNEKAIGKSLEENYKREIARLKKQSKAILP